MQDGVTRVKVLNSMPACMPRVHACMRPMHTPVCAHEELLQCCQLRKIRWQLFYLAASEHKLRELLGQGDLPVSAEKAPNRVVADINDSKVS